MNSEKQSIQPSIETRLEDKTVSAGRPVAEIFIQALIGAGVGLLMSALLIAIYRWVWHVEVSLKDAMLLSGGFCLYCGILSAWLVKRFWRLLVALLESLSA
ncbi:MAG: hypothetical protein QNJ46_04855 [Leptolyngbyaceae cyanobacterium MO_188.B28]|nr:hypothetical protein [Leptolyngbyaceae cyanobacterium MO_188.B28]